MPYIIYVNIESESLIKEIVGCANDPENYSTTKIVEHIFCGYSIYTIWAFDNIENKHTLYREDCMKKFCISLGEYEKYRVILKRRKC